jgi:hypothetical protein
VGLTVTPGPTVTTEATTPTPSFNPVTLSAIEAASTLLVGQPTFAFPPDQMPSMLADTYQHLDNSFEQRPNPNSYATMPGQPGVIQQVANPYGMENASPPAYAFFPSTQFPPMPITQLSQLPHGNLVLGMRSNNDLPGVTLNGQRVEATSPFVNEVGWFMETIGNPNAPRNAPLTFHPFPGSPPSVTPPSATYLSVEPPASTLGNSLPSLVLPPQLGAPMPPLNVLAPLGTATQPASVDPGSPISVPPQPVPHKPMPMFLLLGANGQGGTGHRAAPSPTLPLPPPHSPAAQATAVPGAWPIPKETLANNVVGHRGAAPQYQVANAADAFMRTFGTHVMPVHWEYTNGKIVTYQPTVGFDGYLRQQYQWTDEGGSDADFNQKLRDTMVDELNVLLPRTGLMQQSTRSRTDENVLNFDALYRRSVEEANSFAGFRHPAGTPAHTLAANQYISTGMRLYLSNLNPARPDNLGKAEDIPLDPRNFKGAVETFQNQFLEKNKPAAPKKSRWSLARLFS